MKFTVPELINHSLSTLPKNMLTSELLSQIFADSADYLDARAGASEMLLLDGDNMFRQPVEFFWQACAGAALKMRYIAKILNDAPIKAKIRFTHRQEGALHELKSAICTKDYEKYPALTTKLWLYVYAEVEFPSAMASRDFMYSMHRQLATKNWNKIRRPIYRAVEHFFSAILKNLEGLENLSEPAKPIIYLFEVLGQAALTYSQQLSPSDLRNAIHHLAIKLTSVATYLLESNTHDTLSANEKSIVLAIKGAPAKDVVILMKYLLKEQFDNLPFQDKTMAMRQLLNYLLKYLGENYSNRVKDKLPIHAERVDFYFNAYAAEIEKEFDRESIIHQLTQNRDFFAASFAGKLGPWVEATGNPNLTLALAAFSEQFQAILETGVPADRENINSNSSPAQYLYGGMRASFIRAVMGRPNVGRADQDHMVYFRGYEDNNNLLRMLLERQDNARIVAFLKQNLPRLQPIIAYWRNHQTIPSLSEDKRKADAMATPTSQATTSSHTATLFKKARVYRAHTENAHNADEKRPIAITVRSN